MVQLKHLVGLLDGKTELFLDLFKQYAPSVIFDYPLLKKRVAYSFNCRGCKKVIEYDQYHLNLFFKSGMSLPKTCRPCAKKRKGLEIRPDPTLLKDIVTVYKGEQDTGQVVGDLRFYHPELLDIKVKDEKDDESESDGDTFIKKSAEEI